VVVRPDREVEHDPHDRSRNGVVGSAHDRREPLLRRRCEAEFLVIGSKMHASSRWLQKAPSTVCGIEMRVAPALLMGFERTAGDPCMAGCRQE
jgi:hypothetical protein